MKTAEWLSRAIYSLDEVGIASARLDAQLLLCDTLNCSRAWLLAHADHQISKQQITKLDRLLAARQTHTPLAYLFGNKEFYRREFHVNRHVLVPRPESEALIELALSITDTVATVIDVGCGSGILGITLALERSNWRITLSDISPEALQVAAANVRHWHVEDSVSLRQQDLIQRDKHAYDLMVTNLPYVPSAMQDKADLQAEPRLALFSGTDGLDHYRRLFNLLANRKDHNRPKHLVIEALVSQHQALVELAHGSGYKLHTTVGLGQYYRQT